MTLRRRRRHKDTHTHTHNSTRTHTHSLLHCVFCIHSTGLHAFECNWLSPSAAGRPTGPAVLCNEHHTPTLSPFRRAQLNAMGARRLLGAEFGIPSPSLRIGDRLRVPWHDLWAEIIPFGRTNAPRAFVGAGRRRRRGYKAMNEVDAGREHATGGGRKVGWVHVEARSSSTCRTADNSLSADLASYAGVARSRSASTSFTTFALNKPSSPSCTFSLFLQIQSLFVEAETHLWSRSNRHTGLGGLLTLSLEGVSPRRVLSPQISNTTPTITPTPAPTISPLPTRFLHLFLSLRKTLHAPISSHSLGQLRFLDSLLPALTTLRPIPPATPHARAHASPAYLIDLLRVSFNSSPF
jgi:hypothetical protein